jgi:hypothetical protein
MLMMTPSGLGEAHLGIARARTSRRNLRPLVEMLIRLVGDR